MFIFEHFLSPTTILPKMIIFCPQNGFSGFDDFQVWSLPVTILIDISKIGGPIFEKSDFQLWDFWKSKMIFSKINFFRFVDHVDKMKFYRKSICHKIEKWRKFHFRDFFSVFRPKKFTAYLVDFIKIRFLDLKSSFLVIFHHFWSFSSFLIIFSIIFKGPKMMIFAKPQYYRWPK